MRKRGIVFLVVAVACALFFSVARAEEIRYDKGKYRDPFIASNAEGSYAQGFGEGVPVEGIIYDPEKGSYALIGGEIYREGESVGGTQLVKIFPDRVVLLQNSEELVIWIHEENLEESKQEPPELQ